MKVVQFTIPVAKESTIVVQDNIIPHFYNHLHRHPEIQITWIKEGEGMLIAGNYMQRFKAGDVYIIGANQSHVFKSDEAYYDPEQNKGVHEISFFFNPDHLFQNILRLPEMGVIRKFVEGVHNGLQLPESSYDLIKKIMTEIMSSSDSLRIATFIHLLHSFSTLKNVKPLSTNNNEQIISDVEGIRMDQIFQYVVGNYKNHITLTEIASIANLTPQAFCRYFKKHTDKTFVSFLNEVRVNEACKIVVSGKFDSFSDVSYQTGFDNVTNFNRVFKKTIGKSPREYHRDFFKKLL
jgi:YesN/AraC family two-component response regulator